MGGQIKAPKESKGVGKGQGLPSQDSECDPEALHRAEVRAVHPVRVGNRTGVWLPAAVHTPGRSMGACASPPPRFVHAACPNKKSQLPILLIFLSSMPIQYIDAPLTHTAFQMSCWLHFSTQFYKKIADPLKQRDLSKHVMITDPCHGLMLH